MVPQSVSKRVSTVILVAGPLTTLAISPWFNFDPINPIKIFFLTTLTSLAIGLLIPYFRSVLRKVGRPTVIILLLFILTLLSAFTLSEADKYQQFWGIFGRGTGVLSYIVLAMLFLLSSFVASATLNRQIVFSLLFTTVLMVAYCTIQILKLDPVNWSAFFPFGTLGNVNFLSGFMGVALVSVLIVAVGAGTSMKLRVGLWGLFLLGLFVLYKSDSTQGLVALAVGIASFLVIKSWLFKRPIFVMAISAYVGGFVALVAGLFDKGPFREFIYQFTVIFRADYMHAAVEMLLRNPLNGVGIDAYDDWYRAERGVISALRTSLNRTANSAHNISLDLGAGGGFPLLLSYLALVALVAHSIVLGLKQGRSKDPFFMAIAMSWVAYQVQAAVSINQIGVGVWGWLLGGVIVGTVNTKLEDANLPSARITRSTQVKKTPNTPPPLAVLSSVVFLSIGFLAAYLPLKTDADYLTATKTGSAELVLEIAKRPTANAFLLSKAAQAASSAGLKEASQQIIERLTERFPRNLYGTLVQYEEFSDSEAERSLTMTKVKQIDPFVAICFESSPNVRFRSMIEGLTSAQSYDLARGWGLVGANSSRSSFNWNSVAQDDLNAKLESFCSLS
jgi:O-antigen ligase